MANEKIRIKNSIHQTCRFCITGINKETKYRVEAEENGKAAIYYVCDDCRDQDATLKALVVEATPEAEPV